MSKYRLLILLTLMVTIPLGFLTKYYSGPAQVWVNNSLGGFFYEIFWCLLFAIIFPQSKPVKIALWVFGVTCILEFLQLWHPAFLELIRGNFMGRTILGNSFNWGDFIYYILGCASGYAILSFFKKIHSQVSE